MAAELDLLGEPLWRELAVLKEIAERVRLARTEERHPLWTQWVAQLHGLFRTADAWLERWP